MGCATSTITSFALIFSELSWRCWICRWFPEIIGENGLFYLFLYLYFAFSFEVFIFAKKDTMGNWSEKQIVKQEAKEKDKIRKENLAKYFYDLSKLSFAGLVIGVIIPLYGDFTNENNWYSICTGLILTILSALFANKILR